MNDNFLTQFRESPRPEFARALYDRISQETKTPLLSLPIGTVKKRLVWAMAALCLAFVVALAASPEVRAQVSQFWSIIGGVWFRVTTQPPMPPVMRPLPTASGKVSLGKELSLTEAKAELAFAFKIPTWAPEGFVLHDKVTIHDWPINRHVSLFWYNAQRVPIQLMVRHNVYYDFWERKYKVGPPISLPVPPGSVEEVKINGQPAALIYGFWGYRYDISQPTPQPAFLPMLALQWMEGEVVYWLSADQRYVTVNDLIRMAESMR